MHNKVQVCSWPNLKNETRCVDSLKSGVANHPAVVHPHKCHHNTHLRNLIHVMWPSWIIFLTGFQIYWLYIFVVNFENFVTKFVAAECSMLMTIWTHQEGHDGAFSGRLGTIISQTHLNSNRSIKESCMVLSTLPPTWAPTRNWTMVQMVAALPTTSFHSSISDTNWSLSSTCADQMITNSSSQCQFFF